MSRLLLPVLLLAVTTVSQATNSDGIECPDAPTSVAIVPGRAAPQGIVSSTPKAMHLNDHFGEAPNPVLSINQPSVPTAIVQVPVPKAAVSVVACGVYSANPFSCVAQTQCGWCSARRVCIPGTVQGPVEQTCTETETYIFDKPQGNWDPYSLNHNVHLDSNGELSVGSHSKTAVSEDAELPGLHVQQVASGKLVVATPPVAAPIPSQLQILKLQPTIPTQPFVQARPIVQSVNVQPLPQPVVVQAVTMAPAVQRPALLQPQPIFSIPPVPSSPCAQMSAQPVQCVQNPQCGWCGVSSVCVQGTIQGPAIPSYCEAQSTFIYAQPSLTWNPLASGIFQVRQ